MNALLRDFYGHQAWADAEHWRAIESHPAARDDAAIRARLYHIHLVQRAFRSFVGDRQTSFDVKADDFATLAHLKAWARAYHDEMLPLLDSLSDSRLAERVDIQWFHDPPLDLTVTEALAQCAMHSQWHRGQNATRLRELGAEPPTVDFIVWIWKGRPAAAWTP
jgi:uncharacterized damage-inducible protein DinB